MEKVDTARMLTLVGVVYNTIVSVLTFNGGLFMPNFGPQNPLTWTMGLLIVVTVYAGLFLLPGVGYYRITRAHKRSAGILLIVAGVILTATAILMLAMVIGGALFLAAGALAFSSHPGEVAPVHVAESILPVNR